MQFSPNHSHSCLTHMRLEINPADWLLDAQILESISVPPVGLSLTRCILGLYFSYEKILPEVCHGESLTLLFHPLSRPLLALNLCASALLAYLATGWCPLSLASIPHLHGLTAPTTRYERPLLAQEGNHLFPPTP